MFDYGEWAPGSRVQLCNVTWDAQYANLVDWSQLDRATYFSSLESSSVTITKMTYCAANRPVRIPTPYSRVFNHNYVVVHNSTPVDGESTYYYFITDMRYVAPNTTEILLQLDVWTTYYNRFRFGRMFLNRGHMTNYLHHKYGTVDGREYLTRPEGLDTGPAYLIGDCNSTEFANSDSVSVVIMSTVNLLAAWGTESDPKMKSAVGHIYSSVPYATDGFVCDKATFKSLMAYMSDYPWISQGIMACYMVPNNGIAKGNSAHGVNNGAGPAVFELMGGLGDVRHVVYNDFRSDIKRCLPERYRPLDKFCTSPYSYLEVTTYSGTPMMVAPEMVTSSRFILRQWNHVEAPSPRIMFTVADHDQHGSKPNEYLGYEEHFDAMTGITALPSLPVLNNNATAYAAANAHSIQYARESAKWQQTKALAGANLSAAQTSAGINASYAQTANSNALGAANLAISTNARNQQWGVNTAFGVGTGVVKGAIGGAAGGPAGVAGGAVAGGLSAGVGAAQAYMSNAITNEAAAASYNAGADAANRSTAISAGLAGYVRDGNLELATTNARGDYANAIAGINAKLQDAELTPASISGQLGGDLFNYIHNKWRVDTRIKIPTMGVIRAIGEFWFRYGYAFAGFVNPPRHLMCMTRMTYWQCTEANVFGNVPQAMLDIVRGALQRGTTIWHSPADIGIMDPANNTFVD